MAGFPQPGVELSTQIIRKKLELITWKEISASSVVLKCEIFGFFASSDVRRDEHTCLNSTYRWNV